MNQQSTYQKKTIVFIFTLLVLCGVFSLITYSADTPPTVPFSYPGVGGQDVTGQANVGFTFLVTDADGAENLARPALVQTLFIPADDILGSFARIGCNLIGGITSAFGGALSMVNPTSMMQGLSQIGGDGIKGQALQMIMPMIQQTSQQGQQMAGALISALSQGATPICNGVYDLIRGRGNTIVVTAECVSDQQSTFGRTNIPKKEIIRSTADIFGMSGINAAYYDLTANNFCACEGDYNITTWVETQLQLPGLPTPWNPLRQNLSINYDASDYYCQYRGCGSPVEGALSTWDNRILQPPQGGCCGDDENDDPDIGENACKECIKGANAPEWDSEKETFKTSTTGKRSWSADPVLREDSSSNQCCGDDANDCGFFVEGEGKICVSSKVKIGTSSRSTQTKTKFEWFGGIENFEEVEAGDEVALYNHDGEVYNVSCLSHPIMLAEGDILGCNFESTLTIGSQVIEFSSGRSTRTFGGLIMGIDVENPFEFQQKQYLCYEESPGEFNIGICCGTGSCPSVSKGGKIYRAGESLVQQTNGKTYVFYCTSNNNFTTNLDDPVFGKTTCEAAKTPTGENANFKWTGSYCCGDPNDAPETYNDPAEIIVEEGTYALLLPSNPSIPEYDAFSSLIGGESIPGESGFIPGTDQTFLPQEAVGACFLSRFQKERQFLLETLSIAGRLTIHRGVVVLNGTMQGCAIDQFDRKADGVSMTQNSRFKPDRQEHKPYEEGMARTNDWLLNYPDAPARTVVSPVAVKDHSYCERIGIDADHMLFCSYNETWVFDDSELESEDDSENTMLPGRIRLSYIEWEPDESQAPVQHAECCAMNQCWNGTLCVDDYIDQPQALGYGGDATQQYRCYDGEWKLSTRKYTYDGQYSGFCPVESQCLFNPYGDGSTHNPICVDDHFYTQDHYCENGYWTTRTKILAGIMLESISPSEPYTLYCDYYNNVFNKYSYLIEGGELSEFFAEEGMEDDFVPLSTPTPRQTRFGIAQLQETQCNDNLGGVAPCANKACVLITSRNVFVGITSNIYMNSSGMNALKLFDKTRQQCQAAVNNRQDMFLSCGRDRTVWVHAPLQAVIHAKNSVGLGYSSDLVSRLETTLTTFMTIVMNFVDRNRMLFESIDSAFVANTQDFSRLYLSSNGQSGSEARKVYGVLEENIWSAPLEEGGFPLNYMFINYLNYQASPCSTLDLVRGNDIQSICKQSRTAGHNGYHVVSVQDAFSEGDGFLSHWSNLTAALR